MRVHGVRRVSQGPLAVAIGVSVGLHLLLVAALLLARAPVNNYLVKRGEPLFIELPETNESAQRGAPAAEPAAKAPQTPPAPPAPKAPPTPPTPPAPQVAKAPPAQRPSPPQPTAPQRPSVASAPPTASPTPLPPVPAAPDGEVPQAAKEVPKPAESSPSEPAREPDVQPREIPRTAPPPRVAAVPPESRPSEQRPDIRSALRRGGPGGAGGFGEGRGGITGTPIPLNTQDPRYSDYFLRIQRMIQSKMIYPCVKNEATHECQYKSAQLSIEFGILKDGQLQFVEVTAASSDTIYDDYSVNAIKLAAPFPPVPAGLMASLKPGTTGVPVAARFVYVLESSFRGLVH